MLYSITINIILLLPSLPPSFLLSPCPSSSSYLPFLPAYALKRSSKHNVVMGDCLINGNKLLLSCAGKHYHLFY